MDAVERLRANLGLKAALVVGLATILCGPYYSLQALRGRAALVMPRTTLDDAIPYDERWIWVYLSFYGLLLAPPVLSRSRDALLRFATGFVVVCVVSHVVFLVAPTAIAPSGIVPTDPLMALVLSVDGQSNALPSLHASLAVYAALRATSLLGRSRLVAAVAWAWAIAICYATLPTRRHVVADVVAGAALAAVVSAAIEWLPLARRRAASAEE